MTLCIVALVESGRVKPCKAIDLGCGAGNYATYLAGRGFEITGIDNSPTAIRIARENANKKGVKDELRELFEPHFAMEELKVIAISGKFAPHLVNYVFMGRK
jgi:methylase of polypeptide subunit release factors